MTPEQKEALFSLAREAGARYESMLNSWSGTDQAESEAFWCARNVYVKVAMGEDLEAAIEAQDKRWRAYAAAQEVKVNAAPKTTGRNHPRQGQSVISHRWVSPEYFTGMCNHIRYMVNKVLG